MAHDDPHAWLRSFNALPGGFSAAELDAVVAHGERLAATAGGRDGGRPVTIPADADAEWLYRRLQGITRQINHLVYQFEFTGFSEPALFSTHTPDTPGGFDWRRDIETGPLPPKLVFLIQLSDPADYAGGEIEVHGQSVVDIAPKERGVVIAFPAYTLYRQSPVTSGARRGLTVRLAGPPLR